MTTAEQKALEALFQQEIESSLAGQPQIAKIPRRVANRLVAQGMAEPHTFTLGRDALGAIQVDGFVLSHLGRLTYCQSCPDLPEGA